MSRSSSLPTRPIQYQLFGRLNYILERDFRQDAKICMPIKLGLREQRRAQSAQKTSDLPRRRKSVGVVMSKDAELMVQLRYAHRPLGQESSLGIAKATFTVAAISPELFAEILEEITYNASGMFCQVRYFPDPVHIVSFPYLETLNHFGFQF